MAISQTEYYSLSLPAQGTPLWHIPNNNNFTQIDLLIHNLESYIGQLSNLLTTNKGSLVNAINENQGEINDLETLTTSINNLIQSDDPNLNTLQEIVNYIKINRDNITQKINIVDIQDNLTSTDTNKPLSANQGKQLYDSLQNLNATLSTVVANYASKTYVDAQDTSVLNSANIYTDTSLQLIRGNVGDALDTFQKVANAIDNDPDFYNTMVAYIDNKIQGDVVLQGNYDASTNTPDITTVNTNNENYSWIVSMAGTQTLGDKTIVLNVNDWIIKTASGEYTKIDNNDAKAVWGNISGDITTQTDLQTAFNGKVDKVNGKGLSTNDFTNTEKTNVDALVSNGDGTKFLANDLTYKDIPTGGHVIQDNGTDMPQRSKLNIVGAVLSDDSTNDTTLISISGGGSSSLVVKDEGSIIDGAVNEINFNTGLNVTQSSSGKVEIDVDVNTALVPDTTNKRYVLDTEKTAIGTIGNKFDKNNDTSDSITEGSTKLFLTSAERTKINSLTNLFQFKGQINSASDFPTLSDVQNGWLYEIHTDCVDNDSSKTNTGLSFVVGDLIAWNGTTWLKMSNSAGDMTKSVYDTNNDGIVDAASSVNDGTNISTASQVKTAVTNSHTHNNLSVLNKFSEDTNGKPLYNGQSIGSGGSGAWSTFAL